ncbi:MAG: hypothetical protein F4093_08310 [Gammaproteobacteria bacterium]|nr:hypothetical protein [Gammaproteobacteria bacterium]
MPRSLGRMSKKSQIGFQMLSCRLAILVLDLGNRPIIRQDGHQIFPLGHVDFSWLIVPDLHYTNHSGAAHFHRGLILSSVKHLTPAVSSSIVFHDIAFMNVKDVVAAADFGNTCKTVASELPVRFRPCFVPSTWKGTQNAYQGPVGV